MTKKYFFRGHYFLPSLSKLFVGKLSQKPFVHLENKESRLSLSKGLNDIMLISLEEFVNFQTSVAIS